MKKIKLVLISITLLSLSQCGFITILPPAQWENVDDFKVSSDTKPSELIKIYLGEIYLNPKNNYCITFFDIYCSPCYTQVNYINQLFNETGVLYNWYAVTIYDSIAEIKFREKLGYSDNYLRYLFPVFYEINGFKSSLRNLFYKNSIPIKDYVPMTFIIVNDTIRYINRGAINTEEKYLEHKNLLDSLSQK